MPTTITLIAIVFLLIAGLVAATLVLRGRQRRLLDQRRAQHQLRGANHLRELALATRLYTGRGDIALTLLPLAVQMLEETSRLTPHDPAPGRALRECHNLIAALRDGTAPGIADAAVLLDSESALTRARMELIEASRLLSRSEKLDADQGSLQEMLDALKQTQRSVELRLNLRQAAQTAQVTALHNSHQGGESGGTEPPSAPQARVNPR